LRVLAVAIGGNQLLSAIPLWRDLNISDTAYTVAGFRAAGY
jgi:hypothetical protein